MNKFFGHLKTVCTHKWWVFYYTSRVGIPGRGFIHDFSKFHPVEFFESVKYYTGTRSPIDACKEVNGVSKAWLHHKGKNSHHYEYHQDDFDNGGKPLCMPYKDTIEMLCDFLAAGRAYSGKDFTYAKEYDWWLNKSKKPLAMHPVQKKFISKALFLASVIEDIPDEKILREMYQECLEKYNDK